ncbi:MAG: hypothetical protein JRE72_12800 [Deltaproteobacteria bacterium]|jgi:hypothetical protein|nr:hypothetical protein [Deltaproteobacteria bacterium]
MPMIELADKQGNTRWITVFPFNSLEAARSYVVRSSVVLKIVKGDAPVFWVCNPEDAEWAIKCGYQEVQ